MKRRTLVALVAAVSLAVVGLLVVILGVLTTRTDQGREQIRRTVQGVLSRRVDGRVHVGRVTGSASFFTGVTFDTLAIYDDRGELVVSTGPISVRYDVRDLMDSRIHLRAVDARHPYVHLRQDADGCWNYQRIFRMRCHGPPDSTARRPSAGFGHYVVLEDLRGHDVSFRLSLPWGPADSLRGARRDSAIAEALGRKDRIFRRTADGFSHTYLWQMPYAHVVRARLADPDSNRFGREIWVDTMHVNELEPPFRFRNVRMHVRTLKDSAWLYVPHFDLPGSTGSARGKVVWGSNLPMRYDISVRGDSVSLADVNWVYPTLPTTGGGTVNLHIRNDPRDLRVIEYRLSEMDMRTTGSHLSGAMTFAVGGPVLDIRNVNLVAAPLDFGFLRALNGRPFPVDWRGQIAGTVRARGGPLTRFVVDEARAEFRDANVPGAVSRFTARGGLDILAPIRTTFQSFRVDVATLDLRTIQFLYPNFPPLGGTANGSAVLDSLWEDVRFRNADVTHRNGPGEPTRVTGSGRITYGVDFMRYDVALDARPLSLTMMRRAYPDMPFEGLVSGPIRAAGITPDLQLTTTLTGPGGSFSFDGRVDADSIDGYAARGRGQIAGLDPARVLAPEFAPTFASAINGEYTVDLAGASLATLAGTARLALERSRFDTLRIDAARGAFAFGGGRMTLTDTTVIESPVGRLSATGAIGLERDTGDSVRFQMAIDSLGGFRPWLASTPLDTVAGLAEVTGTLHGAAVSPSVTGSVVATSVAVAPLASTRIDGEFAFRDLFRAPAGDLRLAGQAVEFGAIRFDTASLRVALADSTSARFELGGILGEESHLALAGDWRRIGATSRVLVDTVDLRLGDGRWRLAAPAPIALDSMTTRLDSLVLRRASGDEISLRALIAEEGPSDVAWRATLPVEDLARLFRSTTRPAGRLTTTGTVTGTRLAPVIQAQAMLDSVGTGTQPRLRVDSRVRYADRALELTATAFHDAERTVTGSLTLPVAISLFGAEPVDQPLVGRINADDARLDLVESVTRLVTDVSGRISADIAIGGRMPRAGQALFDAVTLDGPVALSGGEVHLVEPNVTIRDLGARMRFQGTELLIDSIFARSGPARNSFARLSGRASLADTTFDLRLHADDFRVYDRRTLAVLDVATAGSEGMHLRGTHRGDTLTGTIDVERGGIYLPDPKLATKQIGEFDLFAAAAGTGERRGATLMSDLVRNLVFDDVNVVFGDEVYLRSTDATAANIKLSGSLAVTKVARPSATGDVRYQLALTGILNADRGTYTLDLGLLRREFNVTAGTIRFTNDTDFNPVLDIEARHNVNTVDNRGDLAVVVKIVGPLKPTPRIDLTSDQAYEIAPSDLVSYLLIGRPGFDFGQDPDVTRLVTSVLLPSASATLTRGLRALVGGRNIVDQIQFEGASPTSVVGYGDQGYLDYFYRGRWSAEKRINDRLFVSANGGLCQLSGEYTAPSGTSGIEAFGEQLGGQLRYVLEPAERISLLVAAEPSGQALACSKSIGGARGLQQTPRNISVSLLKTWRW